VLQWNITNVPFQRNFIFLVMLRFTPSYFVACMVVFFLSDRKYSSICLYYMGDDVIMAGLFRTFPHTTQHNTTLHYVYVDDR